MCCTAHATLSPPAMIFLDLELNAALQKKLTRNRLERYFQDRAHKYNLNINRYLIPTKSSVKYPAHAGPIRQAVAQRALEQRCELQRKPTVMGFLYCHHVFQISTGIIGTRTRFALRYLLGRLPRSLLVSSQGNFSEVFLGILQLPPTVQRHVSG